MGSFVSDISNIVFLQNFTKTMEIVTNQCYPDFRDYSLLVYRGYIYNKRAVFLITIPFCYLLVFCDSTKNSQCNK